MCCYGSCSIFAGLFTIIQCSFHAAICIWAILINLCRASMPNIMYVDIAWYFTYFYRESCTASNGFDLNTLIPLSNATISDFYELPTTSSATEFTYSFAMAFAILDLVWILSSLILIVGMCVNVSDRKYKIFHLPWLLCCLTISVFDVVAAVIYGKHVNETDTIRKWFQFVGATDVSNIDISEIIDTSNFNETYLTTPSLLMTAIFSRIVFVWLINVVFFYSLLRSVCKKRPYQKDTPPPVHYDDSYSYNAPYVPPTHRIDEPEVQDRNIYSFSYNENKLPNDHLETSSSSSSNAPQAQAVSNSAEDPNSNEARIKRWQLYYGSDAYDLKVNQPRPYYDALTERNSNQKQMLKKNQSRNTPNNKKQEHSKKQSQRSYNQDGYFAQYPRHRVPTTVPQEEVPRHKTTRPEERYSYEEDVIRNQLPWSYLQKRSDKGPPRPMAPEILPPVPVPDYTFKFGGSRDRRRL